MNGNVKTDAYTAARMLGGSPDIEDENRKKLLKMKTEGGQWTIPEAEPSSIKVGGLPEAATLMGGANVPRPSFDLNTSARAAADWLGTTAVRAGRGISETIQNPQVMAALGQFGASLSSPGSVGQQLGQTATQLAQSTMYSKALADVMAGREPKLEGLSPEQQELVNKARERKEATTAEKTKLETEARRDKTYTEALKNIKAGKEFDMSGLTSAQQKELSEEYRKYTEFTERETSKVKRVEDLAAQMRFLDYRLEKEGDVKAEQDKTDFARSIVFDYMKTIDPKDITSPEALTAMLIGGTRIAGETERKLVTKSAEWLMDRGYDIGQFYNAVIAKEAPQPEPEPKETWKQSLGRKVSGIFGGKSKGGEVIDINSLGR